MVSPRNRLFYLARATDELGKFALPFGRSKVNLPVAGPCSWGARWASENRVGDPVARIMRFMRGFVLAALALTSLVPSSVGQQLTRVDVSLGDVSINKVPFLVAADQGLYAKYGLEVHQTISAGAARAAAASGVVVPEVYVSRDASADRRSKWAAARR